MYYIWSKSFYLLLLWNFIFNHSLCCVNICSLWYPRKPSNCVALAVFKPERQSTFSVGSVSLSRWVLIYSYSTHTLRWWGYQARIYKAASRLNKFAKNGKNGNLQRKDHHRKDSQLLHPDLASLPPWVLTTPMQIISMGPHYPHGSTHADPFALSICLYLPFVN